MARHRRLGLATTRHVRKIVSSAYGPHRLAVEYVGPVRPGGVEVRGAPDTAVGGADEPHAVGRGDHILRVIVSAREHSDCG